MTETRSAGSGGANPDGGPEELFAAFVDAHPSLDAAEFDALCAAHPGHVEELRGLRDEWVVAARAWSEDPARAPSIPPTDRLSDRIARTLGADVDPGVLLESDDESVRPDDDLGRFHKLKDDGPRLGRYRMRGLIDRGGQGEILKAWDDDLRRNVAIKVMLPGAVARESMQDSRYRARLSRFLEEAQVTAQLQHPGIIPVHEVGVEADGRVFFTMQHVRGEHFGAIIRKARAGEAGWSITRAVSVLLRACEAMTYAHSRDVIHRDLKPNNLMVGKYGETYVMDWGLARLMGRDDPMTRPPPTQSTGASVSFIQTDRMKVAAESPDSPMLTVDGQILGTPSYMALEQALGQWEKVGPHTDVYSMGAVLYQLLTGVVPYVEPGSNLSALQIHASVRQGPPTPVDELDPKAAPELQAICEKAMARDIARRYRTMAELADDLRAFLEGRVVRAYQTGAIAELRKWSRRNKAAAALIAALVVVAVAGGVIFGVVQDRNAREVAKERDEKASALSVVERLSEERGVQAAELARERDEKQAQAAELQVALGRLRVLSPLADIGRFDSLIQRERELFPVVPELLPKLDAWLADAEEVEDILERYEAELAAQAELLAPEDLPGLEAMGAGLREYHDRLFDGAGRSVYQSVLRRQVVIQWLEGKMAANKASWADASARIADPQQFPAYGGLQIEPQFGLVPIGPNPRTGLWEFWDVASGDLPSTDADGQVIPDPKSGIVLVLLPGGTFAMGAQQDDPAATNFDEAVEETRQSVPVQPVRLAPFFIAKHEVTRIQWTRIAALGRLAAFGPEGEERDLWPMSQLSWADATRGLSFVSLTLPTEAQWEYAARAGTDTPWWFGSDAADLHRFGNYADKSAADRPGVVAGDFDPLHDDGYPGLAPIGRFPANPFGLHDVHGNAQEWCLDAYAEYTEQCRDGDGLRADPFSEPEPLATPVTQRILRGGDYSHLPDRTKVWRRNSTNLGASGPNVGFRAVRPLVW